jgi:hypothetical protein
VSGLPVPQSEAIHAIVPNGNGALILTDYHLFQLQADDLKHRILGHFPDRQAISLAQTEQDTFIGFVDGLITKQLDYERNRDQEVS